MRRCGGRFELALEGVAEVLELLNFSLHPDQVDEVTSVEALLLAGSQQLGIGLAERSGQVVDPVHQRCRPHIACVGRDGLDQFGSLVQRLDERNDAGHLHVCAGGVFELLERTCDGALERVGTVLLHVVQVHSDDDEYAEDHAAQDDAGGVHEVSFREVLPGTHLATYIIAQKRKIINFCKPRVGLVGPIDYACIWAHTEIWVARKCNPFNNVLSKHSSVSNEACIVFGRLIHVELVAKPGLQ